MTVTDPELYVHVYAAAEGPNAPRAWAQLTDLWMAVRRDLAVELPITGLTVPTRPPEHAPAASGADEDLLAAAQAPAGRSGCQAALRVRSGVVVLSLSFLGRLDDPASGRGPLVSPPAWTELLGWFDRCRTPLDATLGRVEIFAGQAGADTDLASLLPPGEHEWAHRVDRLRPDALLRELADRPDDRACRRFVLTAPIGSETASHRGWSDGRPTLPPLARYGAHAALVRYELGVWRRAEERIRELQRRVDDGRGADLRLDARELALAAGWMRTLRRTVEIAAANLAGARSELAPGGGPGDGGPGDGGPLDDDRNLAEWLRTLVDDRLGFVTESLARADARLPASGEDVPHIAKDPRHVFVVHGRDGDAVGRLNDFLTTIGLHPLGWEEVVRATGRTTPYLGDVVRQGLTMAQAVVVLMTPDDVVTLHPQLHGDQEHLFERAWAGQPRPNVLVELGMALAQAGSTPLVLARIGDLRPIADIEGLNYVDLGAAGNPPAKLADRLALAGCGPLTPPDGGIPPDWFGGLSSRDRRPPPPPDDGGP